MLSAPSRNEELLPELLYFYSLMILDICHQTLLLTDSLTVYREVSVKLTPESFYPSRKQGENKKL